MRLRHLAAAIALAAVPALLPVTTAEAAPAVRFTKIYFDSPGADRGGNTSLNAEWFRLKNFSSSPKTITNWRVRDKNGYVYRFPTFTLKAGATVTVHTGKGTRTAAHHYWGRTWYVWNNTGDQATLLNAGGAVVDRCGFSGAGDAAAC